VRQAKICPQKVFGRKFHHSISPTKFKPNLCAEIRHMLFAVLPICAPNETSHPVLEKKANL